jgi:guanylate cyclase
VAGVIGRRRFIYDVWGEVANTASRMESHGIPGEIHVTERLRNRLAGQYELAPRGEIDVKGKGRTPTFVLLGRVSAHSDRRHPSEAAPAGH